jgi:hypothetical protein
VLVLVLVLFLDEIVLVLPWKELQRECWCCHGAAARVLDRLFSCEIVPAGNK